jgi:hypothetical protein
MLGLRQTGRVVLIGYGVRVSPPAVVGRAVCRAGAWGHAPSVNKKSGRLSATAFA